jgi:hypothetical protein
MNKVIEINTFNFNDNKYFLSVASHSHVIETIHAIALPLGASLSLIIMFFFFDSLQTVFIICTASKWTLKK